MKNILICCIGQGGGGIGQMASGAFKSVMGIGQLISGGIKNAKANKMVPSETDPTQVAMVEQFRRLRKGYQTGSEANQYKNMVNQGLTTNANKILALSGGNSGGALAALSGAQASAGEAYNSVVSNLEKNRLAALQMEDQQIDEVAQRRLDIQMMKYLQKKGEGQSEMKAGQQNWMAGVEEFGAGADSFWGGGGMGK